MLTDAERLRYYRTPERVAAADRYIEDLVDAMPPLTPRQRDALAVLLRPPFPDRMPPRPAPAVEPAAPAVEQPTVPKPRRRRTPARETTTAAPHPCETAA